MASYFLDSSALVKAYVEEPGSQRVIELLRSNVSHDVYVARVTHVEVIAAEAGP